VYLAINFSAHEAVFNMRNLITVLNSHTAGHRSNNECKPIPNCLGKFRFDHANSVLYYDHTRILLQPLSELAAVFNSLNYNKSIRDICTNEDIERWHNYIASSHLHASYINIPFLLLLMCTKVGGTQGLTQRRKNVSNLMIYGKLLGNPFRPFIFKMERG